MLENRKWNHKSISKMNKILCILLAVFLLLTGNNIEHIQDSFYLINGTPVPRSNILMTTVNESHSKTELCTQEMLGIRESVFIGSTVRRVLSRRNTKNTLSLIFAVLLLQLLFNSYLAVANVHSYQAHGHSVILSYIHNQDGKK